VTGGLLSGAPTKEPGAIADARRFGCSEAEIAALTRHLTSRDMTSDGVWPENVTAVEAFLFAASQWRTALEPTQHGARLLWIGLDYAGAKVALDANGIAVTPELWSGLVAMELAARDALNGAS
jgi:hypothetical protein